MAENRPTTLDAHPLVAARRILVVPGVYDALSAKLAERAGFSAVVLTGYGLSATHLGQPDFGLLSQTEVLDAARRVISAVECGVIVDGDTGYGGPLNVIRMVKAPDAVLDVDEIAALPLDVWAKGKGYRKLVRNLIGV